MEVIAILKSERKQLILDQLAVDDFVTLESLMALLGTSESTVRRDLDELADEQKLRRVHGGAEKTHSSQEELSNLQKSIKNVQKKEALVQKAVTFIEDGDVIFVDAGTTTELLLKHLRHKCVTVVTNSIHHASQLVDAQLKTMVIGGYVKHTTDASIGQFALEQIRQLHFDKAFIGMNGLDDCFLTTPDTEEAAIKTAVIDNTRQTFVLADQSKIGQTSFVKVARIEEVIVITNRSDHRILGFIKKKTKVIEV